MYLFMQTSNILWLINLMEKQVNLCACTFCGAEGHPPLIPLQRRHHLLGGLGLQLLAVTLDELLLCGAVRHRQQPLHQLDEASVLRKTTYRSVIILNRCDRQWEEEEEEERSYIVRGDGLHQHSFQLLLCEPPAGAQRADGDTHTHRETVLLSREAPWGQTLKSGFRLRSARPQFKESGSKRKAL